MSFKEEHAEICAGVATTLDLSPTGEASLKYGLGNGQGGNECEPLKRTCSSEAPSSVQMRHLIHCVNIYSYICTYTVMRPSNYCKTLIFPSLPYLFKVEIITLSLVEVGSKDQQHREHREE